MSIIVGLTKMTFCEIGEFGLAKHLNETTKEAYSQLAIFTKMANWRKWGNGQESNKGLAKPEKTKTEILTNGDYKKMANFGRTREISAKMASMSKNNQ